MNWMCDVYVYEGADGWCTHVAASRRLFGPIPDWPMRLRATFGATWNDTERRLDYPSRWHKRGAGWWYWFVCLWHNRVHMASLHLIPQRPIGLPLDGESFNDATPGECAERLLALKSMGYKVPRHAIKALREEQVEEF